MSELYQMVMDNMTNAEILAQNQDYILQIDKIDKVRTTILTEKYKETVRLDLEVVYISGATGTGKTRGVLEKNGYGFVKEEFGAEDDPYGNGMLIYKKEC